MYFKIIILVIISLIGVFIKYRMRSQRIRKLLSKFDGARSFPVIGHAHLAMGCSSTEVFRVLEHHIQMFRKKPIKFWLFHRPFVILCQPNDIQVALRIFQKDSLFYSFIAEGLGNGLVTSEPTQWNRSRALMNPAFTSTTIANHYLHIFSKQNYKLIDKLRNEIGMKKSFDVGPYVLGTTYASIHETVLGCDESMNSDVYSELQDLTTRISEIVFKRCATPWLHPSFAFKVYLYAVGCPNIFQKFRDFYTQAIIKKKQAIEKANKLDKTQQERKLLIDVLLETQSFSDHELTDEVLTMLAAGSDTTGTAVAFTLLMLAQNQEIQEKVYRESYNVFGDKNTYPDANQLSRLPFLEQCIKETLRMYPIIPYVVREPTQDLTISDGRIIPAGVSILISLYALHHNSDFYPDPYNWNPDNFSSENVAKRPANTFIPFCSGPRMCIGYRYSMTSMKALLSTFIRQFKISTHQTEVKLVVSFLTKSEDGYIIELNDRQNMS